MVLVPTALEGHAGPSMTHTFTDKCLTLSHGYLSVCVCVVHRVLASTDTVWNSTKGTGSTSDVITQYMEIKLLITCKAPSKQAQGETNEPTQRLNK